MSTHKTSSSHTYQLLSTDFCFDWGGGGDGGAGTNDLILCGGKCRDNLKFIGEKTDLFFILYLMVTMDIFTMYELPS